MDKIVFNIIDLPKLIELINDNGDLKLYQLKPAGRKFGACLNGIDPEFEELIYKNKK